MPRHIFCKYLGGQLCITKIDTYSYHFKNIVKKLMDKQVFILIRGVTGEDTSGG